MRAAVPDQPAIRCDGNTFHTIMYGNVHDRERDQEIISYRTPDSRHRDIDSRLEADFGRLLCYCIGGGRCGDKKLSTRKTRIPSDMQVTNRIACFSKERCDAMRMAASEWPVVTPITPHAAPRGQPSRGSLKQSIGAGEQKMIGRCGAWELARFGVRSRGP